MEIETPAIENDRHEAAEVLQPVLLHLYYCYKEKSDICSGSGQKQSAKPHEIVGKRGTRQEIKFISLCVEVQPP